MKRERKCWGYPIRPQLLNLDAPTTSTLFLNNSTATLSLNKKKNSCSPITKYKTGYQSLLSLSVIALVLLSIIGTANAFSVTKSTLSFIGKKQNTNLYSEHLTRNRSYLMSLKEKQDIENMNMDELAKVMKERTSVEQPFTEEEINGVVSSFESLLSSDCKESLIDMKKLATLLKEVPHLSHKQWDRTGDSSNQLKEILLPSSDNTGGNLPTDFQSIMERVLKEGNWQGAASAAAAAGKAQKPWAVLVTGVNGIRKTTSIYQPWFQDLLREALVPPKGKESFSEKDSLVIPTGQNSFFRQLDHMITIIANKEFENLYVMTNTLTQQKRHQNESNAKNTTPTSDVIDSYARLKDAIFTRYRTLAEMLGILLLRQASQRNMNVMLETSGRDVAMFEYVNKFFSSDEYNKLVLHFTINDIGFAEESVDRRMTEEIKEGMEAIGESAQKVVYVNKGGPYGSEVLKGVQSSSDKVWMEKVLIDGGVADTWYKAEILIEGSNIQDWKAMGITRGENNEEKKGKEYTFERR